MNNINDFRKDICEIEEDLNIISSSICLLSEKNKKKANKIKLIVVLFEAYLNTGNIILKTIKKAL